LQAKLKVDNHISELLYDHDCVIVPEMGGFVASYSHARINAVQQIIEPPSKKIAFNVFLTHNDGLLAEHIARHENLSFNEAVKEIRGYVHHYQEEVDRGKKFIIEGVGVLYADAERHVQFEPFKNVNYLKDSFGLVTVHSVPLENEIGKSGLRFKNRSSIQSDQKLKIENRKLKRANVTNTLLVAGSIFWFLLNLYFVAPSKMDFASLNPFSHASPSLKGEGEAKAPTIRVETVFVKPVEPLSKDSVHPAPSASSENFQNKPPGTSLAEGGKQEENFYIIGGAFRSLKNATRFESELKQQGFADAKIVDSTTSFKMVSLNSYPSLEAAITELNRLKAEKKDVWIFRR